MIQSTLRPPEVHILYVIPRARLHYVCGSYRISSNYGAKNNNLRLALALILERKNWTPTPAGASIRVALSKWSVPYKTNGVFYLVSATLLNVEAQWALYLESNNCD